jgi:hypothetical protein
MGNIAIPIPWNILAVIREVILDENPPITIPKI